MKKYIALFLIINFVFFAGAWPTHPTAYPDENGTLVLGPEAVSPEHADYLIVAAAQAVVAKVAAPAAAHFSLADLIFEEEDDEKEKIRVNKNELRALQLKK